MAIESTGSSVQASTQFGVQQLRLQEAKRNAEQASRTAQSLQQQAVSAQRAADSAQDNARSLTVQSDQAQIYSGRARQGVAALEAAGTMRGQLTATAMQVLERQGAALTGVTVKPIPDALLPLNVPSARLSEPVLNSEGQLTGTLISTTA